MKGQQVYNEKPTHQWVSKENTSLPTVMNEVLVNTSLVDVHEYCDAMGSDVHNAFVQVVLPEKEGSAQVCMKIVGKLVDYLIKIAPETYANYVVM